MVVGQSPSLVPYQGGALVLFTADGGQTWQNRFTSARVGERCWKISFPSKNIGYASVELAWNAPVDDSVYILKTTDQGQTWEEKLLVNANYHIQGIGFLNDSVGWAGGSFSTSLNTTMFHTTNGGHSWTTLQLGSSVNRFRFFGDSLGYFSGMQVHKLDTRLTAAPDFLPENNQKNQLTDLFPNPAADKIWVTTDIKTAGTARLLLLDALGRQVKVLQDGFQERGKRNSPFAVAGLAPGLYIIQLQTGEGTEHKRLQLIR